MKRWLAALIGSAIFIAALALGAWAALSYSSARRAWHTEAARLGQPGYDTARSDARYEDALRMREWAVRAGWLAAIAAGAIAMGWPRRSAGAAGPSSWRRAPFATLIDGALALALLAALHVLAHLDADAAAWSALAIRASAGAVLGGAWASLAAGVTPGMRALGTYAHRGGARPGPMRGALALAVLPIAIVVSPLSAVLSVLRVPSPLAMAPHLRAAGLELATARKEE